MHPLLYVRVPGFRKRVGIMSIYMATASLTNGNKSLRVVGFDSKLQQKRADFKDRQEAVAILNCEVKQSKWSSDLDLHVRNFAEVQTSPTKSLDASAIVAHLPSDLIELSQVTTLTNFQRVTVKAKVVEVKNAQSVKNGLLKQDCVIADSAGTAKLTLWD